MSDANDCPECNGFGLIAMAGTPHAWTRATADDPVDARPRKRCGRCGATAQGRPVPVPAVLSARLIVEDQWGDEVESEASCATCRWAGNAMTVHRLMPCTRDRVPNGATAGVIASAMPLLVKPDFGCVQWEAK